MFPVKKNVRLNPPTIYGSLLPFPISVFLLLPLCLPLLKGFPHNSRDSKLGSAFIRANLNVVGPKETPFPPNYSGSTKVSIPRELVKPSFPPPKGAISVSLAEETMAILGVY